MQEELKQIIEFSKYAKKHLIPLDNGIVSSDFINFIYNSNLDDFIEQFELYRFFADQVDDKEFMSEVRKEAMTAILSQVAVINNDFFSYSILGNNNIIQLRKIIESLGFELVLKKSYETKERVPLDYVNYVRKNNVHCYSIIEKDNEDYFERLKEDVYYFHNKQNGLLWQVETKRNYFVMSSMLYGNFRERPFSKDMKDQCYETTRLVYSDVYGFSYDMTHLPAYHYEQLSINLEFLPHWLIVPTLEFIDDCDSLFGLLNNASDVEPRSFSMMFDYFIDNLKKEQFRVSSLHNINPELFKINQRKLTKELFLIDFMFDAFVHPTIFYKYFERKGICMTKDEVNHFVYHFFNDKTLSIRKIKEKEFVDFVNLFDANELKLILPKEKMLIDSFGVEPTVMEYIKMKTMNIKLH